MNIIEAGKGCKVYLLAGGGRIYSEMVAKFCRSEKSVEEIVAEPYVKGILKSLIQSQHQAALEFDNYIFGIEGCSRVTETQLVRKRHASYMIKSGRAEKHGKRSYDVVIPNGILNNQIAATLKPGSTYLHLTGESSRMMITIKEVIDEFIEKHKDDLEKNCNVVPDSWNLQTVYNTTDLLYMLEQWYDTGVASGIPEEELRYMKPQATEFRAAVIMNASGLYDWFQIRLCNRAQFEIRDMAWKMYYRLMEVHPDIFEEFGPKCKILGYCPEKEQCAEFKGVIPTKQEALSIVREHYKHDGAGPIQEVSK